MQNGREKKPPVNISELKNKQKEEAKQGGLSYLEGDKTPPGSSGSKGKVNLTQLLLSVGLAVLIVIIVGNFTFASKGDASVLLDNQILLESNQAKTAADLKTESGKIDNVIANYATKSELSAVSSQIQGFATQSALDSLKNLILGQGTDIESLEDRLADLEEAINNTIPVVGGGGLSYYISGNQLYVRVDKTSYCRFKFTLVDESVEEYGFGDDLYILEYYTKSYLLEGGEWIHKSLNSLRDALDDKYSDELENYDVSVELLVGSTEPLGEDTDDW